MGAILLAGGKSVRMGEDKALLSFEGMTLLEHGATRLLPGGEEVVVVTDMPDRYSLPGVKMIADAMPHSGPVGGIVTGLGALGEGWHFVLACDMPFVRREVLDLLGDAATPEWDAVVPEIGGEAEPLCALYRHTALPKLRHYLEAGRRSARGALEALNVCFIGEEALRRADPDLISFTNINTPEDWEDALRFKSAVRE